MRRSDRLLLLVQALGDGGLHTADNLARSLGVSKRTVYRDVDALRATGIPVTGTRGTGYVLSTPVTLPPLNLTHAELEALQLGLAVVAEAADEELRAAGRTLADKVDAAVPLDPAEPPAGWGFAIRPFAEGAGGFAHLPPIRAAIRARQKLRLQYRSPREHLEAPTIRPLHLDFAGRTWTLVAWNETTNGFSVFRVDRIAGLDRLPELFVDEDGRSLADFALLRAGGRPGED